VSIYDENPDTGVPRHMEPAGGDPPETGPPPQHYAVLVEDMPPRVVECRCGAVFSGPEPVSQLAQHVRESDG
jgi:hypothetical protein